MTADERPLTDEEWDDLKQRFPKTVGRRNWRTGINGPRYIPATDTEEAFVIHAWSIGPAHQPGKRKK